ncbi:hypothetical protein KYB31_22755 [Clostridium felsineum]|uniref:hypothetical protein n=1 Tax=Clostridium felsineum TaxID=36839 RepID=UPI00214D52E9|nr:hypothetical protein [Clostridium felsineum]MCR3761798.1 hypothetical protein [Clostridium felsineum]
MVIKKWWFWAVIIVVILSGGFGAYKYNRVSAYNKLMSNAEKNMGLGNYTKAINLYKQSLSYKNDDAIVKDIKVAQNLKKIQDTYNEGIKIMNSKKYLEVIDKFKKMSKLNKKLYLSAQDKIKQCIKKYDDVNMQLASDAYKNKKYDDANNYLQNILKVDTNNSDAKKMESEIAQAKQQQTQQQQTQQNKPNLAVNTPSNDKTSKSQPNNNDDFKKQWIEDQVQWAKQHPQGNQNNQSNNQSVPQIQNTNPSDSDNTGTQSDYEKQNMLIALKQEEQEAQQELDNAQNQMVKVYENGKFVWAQDQSKIDSARNRLNQIQSQINALK